jgi:hypothetical protein
VGLPFSRLSSVRVPPAGEDLRDDQPLERFELDVNDRAEPREPLTSKDPQPEGVQGRRVVHADCRRGSRAQLVAPLHGAHPFDTIESDTQEIVVFPKTWSQNATNIVA